MSSYRQKNRSRSRSPRQTNFRTVKYPSRKHEPIHYDRPKFDESPKQNEKRSTIVNQLSTNALRKDNSYKSRPNRNIDSKNYRTFTTNRNGNHHNSNHKDHQNFHHDRRDDRHQMRARASDNETLYKLSNSASVPRSGYYFEHDNRSSDFLFDRDSRQRQDGPRRYDDRKRSESSSTRNVPKMYSNDFQSDKQRNNDRTNRFWRHDKFEEIKNEDGERRSS